MNWPTRTMALSVIVCVFLLVAGGSATAYPPTCEPGDGWTHPETSVIYECDSRGRWVEANPQYAEPNKGEFCPTGWKGRKWYKADGSVVECDGFRWVEVQGPPTGNPRVSPAYQIAPLSTCLGSWTVSVNRSRTASLTLLMTYGDGVTETRVISPGTGSATSAFSHLFAAGYALGESYVQTAKVLETSQTSESLTYHGWDGAPVYAGQTSYSDGATTKSGASGTMVTAFATGATVGREYKLVVNSIGDASPLREVSPYPRLPSSSGVLSNEYGRVTLPPGSYKVYFFDFRTNIGTRPVTFTVV